MSLTEDDLTQLSQGLAGLPATSRGEFALTGTDENIYVRADPAPGLEDVYLGFWMGEPYDVMTGHRVVVSRDELRHFATALGKETAEALREGEEDAHAPLHG